MSRKKVRRSALDVDQTIFNASRLRRQARQIRTIGIWSALLLLIIMLLAFGLYYLLYPYGWNEEIHPTIQAWLQDKNTGQAYQYEFDKLAAKYNFDYNDANSMYYLFFMRPQDVYNILNDINADAATFNSAINNFKTQSTLGGKIDVLLTLDQKMPLNIAPLKDVVTFLKANPEIVSFLKAHPELTLDKIVQIAQLVQQNQGLVNFLASNPNLNIDTITEVVSQLQKNSSILDLIKTAPSIARFVAQLAGIDLSSVSDDQLKAIADEIPKINLDSLKSFDLNSIPRDQLSSILETVSKLNINQLQSMNLDAVDQVQPITIPIQKAQVDAAYTYVHVLYGLLALSLVGLVTLYATSCLRMGMYRWQGIKVSRTWANVAFVLLPLFWVINFLMAAQVFDAIAIAQRPYILNKLKMIQEKKQIRQTKTQARATRFLELSPYEVQLWHMPLLG